MCFLLIKTYDVYLAFELVSRNMKYSTCLVWINNDFNNNNFSFRHSPFWCCVTIFVKYISLYGNGKNCWYRLKA